MLDLPSSRLDDDGLVFVAASIASPQLRTTMSHPPQNPFADQPPGPPQYQNPYAPAGRTPDIADDPAMRWVLPVGQSIWSIAAGYLGLLSLAICFLGPFAILCGAMAIREMRANPRISGWGRAIVGLFLGTLGTLGLVAMILVFAFAK